jgi:hypothetical protein
MTMHALTVVPHQAGSARSASRYGLVGTRSTSKSSSDTPASLSPWIHILMSFPAWENIPRRLWRICSRSG